MLREWHTPVTVGYSEAESSSIEQEEDIVHYQRDSSEGKPNIGSQLNIEQKRIIQQLLQESRDVMRDTPGRTDKI